MKNRFIFLFVLILGLSFVSSLNASDINCQNILSEKDSIIGISIPDKVPFTNEIFNVYMSDNFLLNIEINQKTIDNISCIENNESTYTIIVKNETVVQNFIESDDILTIFLDAKKSKDIQVIGNSFSKKTKMFFVNIGLKIFSWFN